MNILLTFLLKICCNTCETNYHGATATSDSSFQFIDNNKSKDKAMRSKCDRVMCDGGTE